MTVTARAATAAAGLVSGMGGRKAHADGTTSVRTPEGSDGARDGYGLRARPHVAYTRTAGGARRCAGRRRGIGGSDRPSGASRKQLLSPKLSSPRPIEVPHRGREGSHVATAPLCACEAHSLCTVHAVCSRTLTFQMAVRSTSSPSMMGSNATRQCVSSYFQISTHSHQG